MGQMAELNLAACREENVRLRAAVGRLQGMVNGLLGQDRRGAMEVVFIGAALHASTEGGWRDDDDQYVKEVIEIGRRTARLYIEALTAEAENGGGDEGARPEDSGEA